ncbi:MAG TPA: methyltransferase domain-containing protein [Pseudogracilibacillus sp.]|nr:methyltransferase domain-containing protein [Pseudogracilibacillus sp.]
MGIKPKNDKWNASLYDEKHGFVSQYGENLVQILAPKQGENILDIGCGTGDIAKIIHDHGAKVQGIDASENMIAQARDKYPDISFDVMDAMKLNYQAKFDAVFSNATLHWIKQAKSVLQGVYESLKTDGRFVAEFGGKGNVQMITNEIRKQAYELGLPYQEERFPWYFPSIAAYTSLMEEVGFTVTFAHLYDRPTRLERADGLKNWIRMFGHAMFGDIAAEKLELITTNVENSLRETMFQEDAWIADYKRLRVMAVKA